MGGQLSISSESKVKSVKKQVPLKAEPVDDDDHTLCLIQESPLRILRVAELGNVKEFERLLSGDPTKLQICDNKGRTVVHLASLKNHVGILKVVVEYGGSLEALDNDGNTPLHVAVGAEAVDVINFLLQNGVNPTILNKRIQAPIHVAAEAGKAESLRCLAKYAEKSVSINVNQPGEHGRTALHLACIHNRFECVNILIEEFKASPRRSCSHSFLPVHEAAKHGSVEALENLLMSGSKSDCSAAEMMNLPDAEGNLAIHAAVQSGDSKTVKLCLENGSKISDSQKELSNAVHLACAQGSIEIVKLMFNLQPEEKDQSLMSCDLERMTPLHQAAMFDHTELVVFLVEQQAHLNSLDKNGSTPLHLAASKNALKTVKSLIALGADTKIQDNNGRTVLHTIVKFNGDLSKILDEEIAMSFIPILEIQDKKGDLPLHIATKNGQVKSVNKLLTLGSNITVKNADGATVLHTACRFGRTKIIQIIVEHRQFASVLNESDNNGWTPFHIAAQEGHQRVLQILMKKGAFLHKDYNGRSALHLAAGNGHKDVVRLILFTHSHLIDMTDKNGNTPLHTAALRNQTKVADLLLRQGCQLTYNEDGYSAIDLALVNKFVEVAYVMATHKTRGDEILGLTKGKCPCIMETLIAKMPAVAKAVLDTGIIKSTKEKLDAPAYHVEYDFKWLTKPPECLNEKSSSRYLPILNDMVAHNRVGLLSHELTSKYLDMKWNAYGKHVQITNFILYLIFLIALTYVTTDELLRDPRFFIRWYWFRQTANSTSGNGETCPGPEMLDVSGYHVNDSSTALEAFLHWVFIKEGNLAEVEVFEYTFVLIALISIINIVVELVSICRHGVKYCQNIDTWVWIAMNFFCVVAQSLVVQKMNAPPDILMAEDYIRSIINPSLAVASFMGWFYLLIVMQRFDAVGLYVSMFLEILKTLLRVLVIFSILIVAFALTFFVLLSNGNHIVFSGIPMSIMRTFSMMLGDLDFMNTFVYPHKCEELERGNKTHRRLYAALSECTYPRRIPHPYATFPAVGIYMVFMPIVMINLLIGLAVGDIEAVRKNAQLKRLSMQVQIHTNIEKSLPQFILKRIDKTSVIEYPNKKRPGILEQFVKFFAHADKKDDGDEVDIESDDLMEAILDNSVTLGQLTSDMENVKTMIQLICTKLNINSDMNADEGTPADEINPMPDIRKGLQRHPTTRVRKKPKLQRSDSSDSNN